MASLTRKTSNTGDMPTPQPAARASCPTGTHLTRVTPVLSTQHSATTLTPSARSFSATVSACRERSARTSLSSSSGPASAGPAPCVPPPAVGPLPACVFTKYLVAYLTGLYLANRLIQDRNSFVHLRLSHDQWWRDLHNV